MLSVTTGFHHAYEYGRFFFATPNSRWLSENPQSELIDQCFWPSPRLLFSHTAFHNKNKTKLPMCAYYDKFPQPIQSQSWR